MFYNKLVKYLNKQQKGGAAPAPAVAVALALAPAVAPVAGYATDIGGRPYQEDRIAIFSGTAYGNMNYRIFCVFDGHGGAVTSEYLMQNLPGRCKVALDATTTPITVAMVQQIITDEFAKIDAEAIAAMRQQYTGSTASMCIVFDNYIFVANIADSPAILFDRAGVIKYKTNIHDCNNPLEFDRINADNNFPLCQNMYGPYRLSKGYIYNRYGQYIQDPGLDMTRAFGDNAYKPKANAVPQLYVWAREAGDILCICSDSFLDEKLDHSASKQNEQDIVNEVLPVLTAHAFNTQTSAEEIVNRRTMTIPNADNTSMILVLL
jgi:serine/threonine protein phosphatase PrpC